MKYPHLLQPLQIGNVVLRNRILSSNALPHFLQGPELYPAEPVLNHYASLARNGAAIVTVSNRITRKSSGDGAHIPLYDLSDLSCDNYISQLADVIHWYGAKASLSIMQHAPIGWGVVDSEGISIPPMGEGAPPAGPPPTKTPIPMAMMRDPGPKKMLTPDKLQEITAEIVQQAKYWQTMGFDMLSLHMSYMTTIFCQFLSPVYNTRTDEFGGCLENRARFPLMVCQAVKEACGKDFLIEVQISGEDEGGFTVEDLVAFAKLAEGTVDILQLRAANVNLAHPVGFNSTPHQPVTLQYAEAVKASGANIIVAPCGGYQDPNDIERWLQEGKIDMAAMGRALFCDPDYYEKIVQGRTADIVPCIRCDRCHGISRVGPWLSVCSVNPKLGHAHRLNQLVAPPKKVKRVAVVGGGPAGMKAALTAAERGHQVTLYEMLPYLGGQLHHADYASFKWPVKNYKNYLIDQLNKSPVEIHLNTRVTASILADGNFDVVLAALGAEPVRPNIPGVYGPNVITAYSVYGNESVIGKRVVVIGGSETGTETGMYLAEQGHEVTVLTRQSRLAPDMTPIHYSEMVQEAWEALPTFQFITRATTTQIRDGSVVYTLSDGTEAEISCDTVVVNGGMRSRQTEAQALAGIAPEFYIIGDNAQVGNIQTCTRSAFSIASTL